MSSVEKEQKGITRRDFIKGAAAGGAAGLVVGAGGTALLMPAKEVVKEVVKEVPKEVIKEVIKEVKVPTTGVLEPAFEPEETVIKASSLSGGAVAGGDPVAVDIKNGRIVRVRPLHYDETGWTKEELASSVWKIEARGKVFQPRIAKSTPGYLGLSYKKRVYSPNRVKYPLKRVDWEPGGDPAKINPQNRGKSKFKRISWDEAATILASEIKRIQEKYGAYAVCCHEGGHAEAGNQSNCHGFHKYLLGKFYNGGFASGKGGFTGMCRDCDSWEGWYWGAMHVWGTGATGHVTPNKNILKDVSENTTMLVWVGADYETTPQGFGGNFASDIAYWFDDLGITQVHISPELNYMAAVHKHKWIPVLPNTDAAWALAVIYTWITEGTYDKQYIATHSVGFDKIEAYVMGKEDGVPKTPAWASPRCGIPEWTLKALAREMASKVTSVAHNFGGSMMRGPYGHEPTRLMCVLLGMMGLGKPGVNQVQSGVYGAFTGTVKMSLTSRTGPWKKTVTPQFISKCWEYLAISNPPVTAWGSGINGAPVEDQFVKYTFPIPKEKGGTEIHMLWEDGPTAISSWNRGFYWIDKVYRNPKIECVVTQQQWLEDDSLFSDIVLPISTLYENDDILISTSQGLPSLIFRSRPAITRIGESRSDSEALGELAKKQGIYDQYTEGKTTLEEWIKYGYETSGVKDVISWEKLNERKFYMSPVAPGWEKTPAGLIAFYQDPVKAPLGTPSGKLEFYSQRLADKFPDDKERGPYPKYVIGGPGWWHDESIEGERCKKYPLLLESNHPRWRCHSSHDDATWLREIPTCKVKGYDGYMYEPVWIHPTDAAKRGIQSGDIVKVYNDRGTVLGGAIVWERIIPGAVYQDHGAKVDPIATGPDEWIDRGGSNNVISPEHGESPNAWGMSTSGFLVEVEKLDPREMEQWRKKYPEAFARDYDPACGLRYGAWVEGGMD